MNQLIEGTRPGGVVAEGNMFGDSKGLVGDSWSFKDFTKKYRSQSSSNVDIGRRLSWSCRQKYNHLVHILLHDIECIRLG